MLLLLISPAATDAQHYFPGSFHDWFTGISTRPISCGSLRHCLCVCLEKIYKYPLAAAG